MKELTPQTHDLNQFITLLHLTGVRKKHFYCIYNIIEMEKG